ncbi:MAG: hypothetical protein GF416_07715 [Candidatus Altiarchaeales archaeon]|nr:hypothetical protein [Candidatus Altiarchaeales archaeon]MBD3416999.1 hypothetical protein [Candidatus Altiarchaeales archaeon]
MICAAHQPNYMPWLGFFNKIHMCDIFVLMDCVQYPRRQVVNRNRIKTPQGWTWLTVPVSLNKKISIPIREVLVDNSQDWGATTWKSIVHNYKKAGNFDRYSGFIEDMFHRRWDHLAEVNEHFIRFIVSEFDIETKLVRESDLEGVAGTGSERLVSICKAVGSDEYLSGDGSAGYLEPQLFEENGIGLSYQGFEHPRYRQMWGGFLPNMSIVDLILNEGEKSVEYVR